MLSWIRGSRFRFTGLFHTRDLSASSNTNTARLKASDVTIRFVILGKDDPSDEMRCGKYVSIALIDSRVRRSSAVNRPLAFSLVVPAFELPPELSDPPGAPHATWRRVFFFT